MAYLHCHGKLEGGKDCNWSQDDFWEKEVIFNGESREGYTPLKSNIIKGDIDLLFKEKTYMDSHFFRDNPEIPCQQDEAGWYCKGTDLVSWDLERRAKRIRNMLVRTYEEFKQKKDTLKCPRCGQQNWDID